AERLVDRALACRMLRRVERHRGQRLRERHEKLVWIGHAHERLTPGCPFTAARTCGSLLFDARSSTRAAAGSFFHPAMIAVSAAALSGVISTNRGRPRSLDFVRTRPMSHSSVSGVRR